MLTKTTQHHGKNWDKEILCALWAYRTAIKTSTGFSPYHLVYGKQALLPIEVEIPALRMMVKLMDPPEDYYKNRLLQLQELQLDRSLALDYYVDLQNINIKRANRKVKDKKIEEGDLVLRYNSKLDSTFHKKF